ncbi:1-acyl-sn-glycerol-3-phosphate acyltransferase [Brevundimonas diminuta]|uniref:1-acyl-sn-glycerol-3-phosphate acyltransferase n=1 Tax=Brevundimonas diminuta TaxID=293 RepID=UPI0020975769|nr:1-acyl-sn-glycerol-3-phosphate acyltransferase [Brevundimonas diminuta]MCO8018319.1 1-acyl-sn-glycerol-3-phosphate acyltransferase [Brevundimonas diminuta]MCO8022157.1 1-acyl-sn-glycerol-3-phosphate acyltransferase [Brevundimonas diminuta]
MALARRRRLGDKQAMSPAPHIVDVLIAERAPRLTGSAAWPLVRPALYGLLDYAKARRMADAIGPMGGRQALDYVSDLLELTVRTAHLDRLPVSGRCLVVCNHPTGIADGLAVHDALRTVRDDLIYFANADALRVSPRLSETVVPVEWVTAKRTREKTRATLQAAKEAFEAERCVVMFPAGRLARVGPDGLLTDPEWAATAASLARKYEAPVIPIHVSGPTSRLFHLFDKVSQELRDITLFHELLNKKGHAFDLIVGRPIPPLALDVDAQVATLKLKTFVERTLAADPDATFA